MLSIGRLYKIHNKHVHDFPYLETRNSYEFVVVWTSKPYALHREHHVPSRVRPEFAGHVSTIVSTSDPTKSRDDKVNHSLQRNPSYLVPRAAKMVLVRDMTVVPQQRKQHLLLHPFQKHSIWFGQRQHENQRLPANSTQRCHCP